MKPKGIPLRMGSYKSLSEFMKANRLKTPKYKLAQSRFKGLHFLLRTKR
jgi:hypothetical protein